jgi:CDP-glucose 4,6-dehydratase
MRIDRDFWRSRRILLTGHTGFKGAWLSRWLTRLGARVVGLSLPPATEPSLHTLLATELAAEHLTDLGEAETTRKAVEAARADVVLHLAAQSLVPESYANPVSTFRTNVLGTIHLLDALRALRSSLNAVVIVTTDKVYANDESGRAFVETDPLGGDDPYSASKAAVEIAVHAWKRSFMSDGPPLGTARAGNVIGGGDWAPQRLIPDIVRAARSGRQLEIRRPDASRPWQHVLDPLHGYLLYAQAMASGASVPGSLNFAPNDPKVLTVREIADSLTEAFGINGWRHVPAPQTGEKKALALDASLAYRALGWKPEFTSSEAIASTIAWYKAWAQGDDVKALTDRQIAEFEEML